MSRHTWDTANCPDWCGRKGDVEYPCSGEHWCETGGGHIPATAGGIAEPVAMGTAMTTVSAGLSWPQPWGGAVGAWINFYGDDLDRSVTFTIGEAMLFHLAFADALSAAMQAGVIPEAIWENDKVADALARLDAVRLAWVGEPA